MGSVTLNVAVHLTRGYVTIQKLFYKNDLGSFLPRASNNLVTAPKSPSVQPCFAVEPVGEAAGFPFLVRGPGLSDSPVLQC